MLSTTEPMSSRICVMIRDLELYAATSNAGKLREFARSASGAGMEVLPLPGVKEMPEPVEDASTFMGNAEIKAVEYSKRAPGLVVFADDSGIEVAALGGEPGVRSARWAEDAGFTEGATKDARNNGLLLSRMKGVADRQARFVCALALARDGEVLLRAEGYVAGEVLEAPRGVDGFGYDPLFLVAEMGVSAAELSAEAKWEVSHRGRAFRELLRQIAGSPDIARDAR
jgi:XTP/dITP diphosphohydrolase